MSFVAAIQAPDASSRLKQLVGACPAYAIGSRFVAGVVRGCEWLTTVLSLILNG